MACRRQLFSLPAAVIIFAAITAPAGATPVLFTDRTSWQAAGSGLATITFEGLATPAVPGNYSTSAGLTLGGVQFIGLTPPASYYLYVQDPGASTNYDWGSGDLLMGPSQGWGGGYIQANLPDGTTWVGSDIMTHTPFAASVVITLSTGHTFTVSTLGRPERAFVGFTSDAPITFIRFTPNAGFSLLDNFSYGTASEVPEAASVILGGAGLFLLLIARCLRRLPR